MAVPMKLERDAAGVPHESYLHFAAREARLALRWLVILSAIATVVTMVIAWFFALIPAMLLLVFYVLLAMTNIIEHRSTGPHEEDEEMAGPRAEAAAAPTPHEIELAIKRESDDAFDARTMRIIIEIVAGLSVIALVIAGLLFGWELLAIGAVVLLAYMLLIAAPVWLGWIEDDVSEHAEPTRPEPS